MSPTYFIEICDSDDLENKFKVTYYGPHNDVFVPVWSYSGHWFRCTNKVFSQSYMILVNLKIRSRSPDCIIH